MQRVWQNSASLDQDQSSKITQFVVHQRSQESLPRVSRSNGSFDWPWSKGSWIIDSDPDHPTGMHSMWTWLHTVEPRLTATLFIQPPPSVITITLFWPSQKLSQSFSYLNNPINMATFLWPVGDWINRLPLYVYRGLDVSANKVASH